MGTVGVVLELSLLAGDSFQIVQTGGVSVVMSLQSTCDAAGACTTSVDAGENLLDYTATVDEVIYAVIENNDLVPADASYNISVFINAECGNGVLEPLDACDDGNLIDGDGCSAECRPEFAYECDQLSPSTCSLFPSLGTFGADEVMPELFSRRRDALRT